MSNTIIDIFSGCGGLSYGFEQAGFTTVLGVDNCQSSLETYKANHPHSEILCEDIQKVTKKSNFINDK